MIDLLKGNLRFYCCLALFFAIVLLMIVGGIIKKTRLIESKLIKYSLRNVITFILVSLWLYYFICLNIYPLSYSYYEYKNNITGETVGVIEGIEYIPKDRLVIKIGEMSYTMVYSSQDPYKGVGEKIKAGDNVRIIFGKKSGYVFDIWEIHDK